MRLQRAGFGQDPLVPNSDIAIDVTHTNGVVLASVRGEIDVATATELEAELQEVAAEARVVLDLSAVKFMDSSGLAVILRQAMHRRDAGGSVHIRQPSESVRRLLEFCCLDHLLEPAE